MNIDGMYISTYFRIHYINERGKGKINQWEFLEKKSFEKQIRVKAMDL